MIKQYIISFIFLFFLVQSVCAQKSYVGMIVNNDGGAIEAVTIEGLPKGKKTNSDKKGRFILYSEGIKAIKFSRQGYKTIIVNIGLTENLGTIKLDSFITSIEEIQIHSGYNSYNKNRGTGSVYVLDNKILNIRNSANIIDRLEGLSSGLQFDRNLDIGERQYSATLRMRGINSIHSNSQPLIILDDFPYEGNISNINPNDIESVNLLKDASASAIWGARAGNGVIVLTSKRGKDSKGTKISALSNLAISEKPNLYYDPKFLPSKDMMEIEEYLYGLGNYTLSDRQMIPDYVALLFQRDKKLISQDEFLILKSKLQNQDIKKEALKYLYQQEQAKRVHFSLAGRSELLQYRSAVGYENNLSSIIGNKSERLTLNFNNQYSINKAIKIDADLQYAHARLLNNGYNYSQLTGDGSKVSSYTQLKDEEGKPTSLNYQYNHSFRDFAEQKGLLRWTFNPIVDRENRNLLKQNNNLQLSLGFNYQILEGLDFVIKYRYQSEWANNENLYKKDSYYVRNLVNRYTQKDGAQIIPHGAIKEGNVMKDDFQNGRIQINYNKIFTNVHEIQLLAGSEINHQHFTTAGGYRYYGYDYDNLTFIQNFNYNMSYPLRPSGSGFVPTSSYIDSKRVNRFLSHYFNGTYLFKDRHIVSTSIRWDASNLFGVTTNQRGVPLWSIGFSEDLGAYFQQELKWLNMLKLRGSYGISGNVNNTISSKPIMRTEILDFVSGLPYASLKSAGNASLRWEKLKTLNLGLDFQLFNNLVKGSVDFYEKRGEDLIGQDFVDPTTGIINQDGTYLLDNRINYADLKTQGLDLNIQWNAINVSDFQWYVNFLWSWTRNRITNYKLSQTAVAGSYISGNEPREGFSKDALFAWSYGGLNPENGQLLTPNKDQNYASYFSEANFEDLLYVGVKFPPYQGSIRNSFIYKRWSLDVLLEWKNGFVFRNSSLDYNRLFSTGVGHIDYLDRWQRPGDESYTQVPSLPENRNSYRESLYAGSEIHIQKGDQLRFSNLHLSYNFRPLKNKNFVMNSFFQIQNLGIIWRENNKNIDTESVQADYPKPRMYTLGLQINW